MKIIISGGGKVGYYLVKMLTEHGYNVTLIEESSDRCRACANELDAEVICGDGTRAEVLQEAGAKQADAVIAVMGQDENNLVCCQMAKELYGVKKTVAKVNNPRNTETMKKLGIDIVVSATDNIIHALEKEVDISAIKEILPLGNGISMLEITLPEKTPLEDVSLMELTLPQQCNIFLIQRDGSTIIPRGYTKLKGGDVLMAAVHEKDEKELARALKIKH